MSTTSQIEYAAVIRDVRAGATTRETFRAASYLDAKALYSGRGNVDSHVGPVSIRLSGVVPISTVRAGSVVTVLNTDGSIGEVGRVVTDGDTDPSVRCFFEQF